MPRGDRLLALAPRKVRATSSAPLPARPFSCSAIALLRALVRNLIENGAVTGAADQVDVRPRGAEAIVTVSDGGAGVAESDRERIFSPVLAYRIGGIRPPASASRSSGRSPASTAATQPGSAPPPAQRHRCHPAHSPRRDAS